MANGDQHVNELKAINDSVQEVKEGILGIKKVRAYNRKADQAKEKSVSPAQKEEQNQSRRQHKNLMGMFGGMKKGIMGMSGKLGGLASKLGGMAKAGAGGLMGMIKKGAMFLAIPALLAFMQSPLFEDLKKWIVDDLIPALGRMVDAIKPVATAIISWVKDSFLPIVISQLVQGFKDLSTFFSDVFARFSGWSDMTLREKIAAVLGIFTNITELVGKLVGNMIEAVANLFGADGATIRKKYWDPIAKFFTDIVDAVLLIFTDPVAGIKKLFATLWDAAKGIGGFFFDIAIKPAWDWIKGLFGFGPKEVTKAEGGMDDTEKTGLWAWIKGIPSAIWGWIKGLFGFTGSEEADPKIETGETKGFFGKVMRAIIPAGIWTFLEDPILWFWVNVLGITTGVDGKKPSAAEAAEQIKSGEATGIFAKVMGAFLPQGMIEFILDPIDWIFVNVLKLGGDGEKKESTAQKAGMILGTAVGLFEKVLGAILPAGLVTMIMSPINWLFESVLGIKPDAVLDSVSEAHGVEKGDATGLWQSMLDAILPAGLAKFLGDPIGYIFTDILKLGGKDGKAESTKEQSKVIAGVAVGLFKSVLKAILPDGLVDFIMKPLDWLMGKLGINVGESMASASEAHGVAVGDTKGLFKSILDAILPAGLVDFIMSPVTWLLTKVGITKNEETGELTDASGKVLTPAEALEQSKGVFSKVLKAILPDGLVDFIMGPWSWIKTKFGWGDTSTEKMDMVDAEGKPIVVGETQGIFDKILKAMLPDGLVDFLMHPIDWILGFLGIKKDTKQPSVPGAAAGGKGDAAKAEKAKMDMAQGLYDAIGDLGWGVGYTFKKFMDPEDMLDVLSLFGFERGGLAKAGQFAMVGEKGPELIKFKQPGVVASNEQMKAGRDYAMNAMRAGATGPSAAGGQAPILVNNITNTPVNNSMQANTKISTALGSSDPFTNVAVAY